MRQTPEPFPQARPDTERHLYAEQHLDTERHQATGQHPDIERGSAPLSIRLRLGGAARIGPGKVALLEAIARSGRLNDAAQAMGMSARRAWLLVDSLNQAFDPPLVQTEADGSGMQLTALGLELIEAYRAVEQATAEAVVQRFGGLEARLRSAVSDPADSDPADTDPADTDPADSGPSNPDPIASGP